MPLLCFGLSFASSRQSVCSEAWQVIAIVILGSLNILSCAMASALHGLSAMCCASNAALHLAVVLVAAQPQSSYTS